MNGPDIKRLYYSTSEVSDMVRVRPYIIRKWEEKFPFLNSVKKSSGRKFFKPDDVAVIKKIKKLKESGYTNEKVNEILTSDDHSIPEKAVPFQESNSAIPLLQEIYRELQEILDILKKSTY